MYDWPYITLLQCLEAPSFHADLEDPLDHEMILNWHGHNSLNMHVYTTMAAYRVNMHNGFINLLNTIARYAISLSD